MTNDPDRNEDGQFVEGNTGAEKHGLYTEDESVYQSLSDNEQRIVAEMGKELVERYEEEHGEEPGTFEIESMRNMVLDVIKRRRANDFFFEEGLDFDSPKKHNTYSRILRDYHDEMESLGIARDPESEKHKAEGDWFDAMSDAQDDE